MDKQPILSLCIPTNGAVEWILPVIESIYSQGCDNEKFEVVITDNGKDSQLPGYIDKMEYPNLRYKQTTDEGFLNLVTCLKEGNGLFSKMINHRSVLVDGSIQKMVDLIERYKESQPIIYCASGMISKPEIVECEDLNEFVHNLSYWCSWSAGIGFWKNDLPQIDKVRINEMFPNASLLFEVRQESRYVIWNYPYQTMADDAGKGGYDLFETFGVNLLDIFNDLRIRGRISLEVFVEVKKDLYGFLRGLFFNEVVMPTKHTFILNNVEKSMSVYYGHYYYKKMVVWGHIKRPFVYVRRFFMSIIRK